MLFSAQSRKSDDKLGGNLAHHKTVDNLNKTAVRIVWSNDAILLLRSRLSLLNAAIQILDDQNTPAYGLAVSIEFQSLAVQAVALKILRQHNLSLAQSAF